MLINRRFFCDPFEMTLSGSMQSFYDFSKVHSLSRYYIRILKNIGLAVLWFQPLLASTDVILSPLLKLTKKLYHSTLVSAQCRESLEA